MSDAFLPLAGVAVQLDGCDNEPVEKSGQPLLHALSLCVSEHVAPARALSYASSSRARVTCVRRLR